ncbi:protein of unknown function [Paraburkholderia kururiensis]
MIQPQKLRFSTQADYILGEGFCSAAIRVERRCAAKVTDLGAGKSPARLAVELRAD